MSNRLADVARKVGVSQATVSRVLNNRPGVSEETRQAVLTALDVLGYERPTQLRGERARLVGLVLPELQNPIFPALAEILSGALTQNGYTALLCTQRAGGLSDAEYIDLLLEQQVSGVIYLSGSYTEGDPPKAHYARLKAVGLPTVVVNGAIDAQPFPAVSTDDVAAAEQAVEHLHQFGHRKIGLLIGGDGHVPSQRKLEGATRAFNRLGFDPGPDLIVRGMFSIEAGQSGATRLLAAGATAIVCASDLLALGAMWSARRAGLSVPRDVSVVGYDDSTLMNFTDPPLTTVRQPIDSMGRAVIDMLLGQISGTVTDDTELFFEPEFVLRGSTGPAPQARA